MKEITSKYIIKGFIFLIAATMVLPFLASCGKSGDGTPTSSSNSTLLFANLSLDALPVNLYTNNLKQNSSAYNYPSPSSYFALSVIGQPLQIRHAGGTQGIIITSDSVTHVKGKYSLFLTGLASDSSFATIFMVDTIKGVPTVGTGVMRFVNASPRSGSLDVYANGTKLFDGVNFKNYTAYKEMPAGNYNITIYTHGDQTTILKQINPATVSDGSLYTLYSYGIVGRTDTAAFNAGIITNK